MIKEAAGYGREKGQKSNFFQNHFVAGLSLRCILPFLPDCRSFRFNQSRV